MNEIDRKIKKTLKDIFEYLGVTGSQENDATVVTYVERLLHNLEVSALKNEAKLGNIPYKEAIELQKENEKLKAENEHLTGLSDAMCDMNSDTINRGFELITKLQSEIAALKEEAKLGNIPYKEAIELQKENEKLQARLKEVEGENKELRIEVANSEYNLPKNQAKRKRADILRKGEM